jgi:hypothetical protein
LPASVATHTGGNYLPDPGQRRRIGPRSGPLLADYTRKRYQGQGQIARALAQAGKLRPELKGRDAADIIHALMSPEVYRLVVVDRGWKPERYEQWLRATLIEQLLPELVNLNEAPLAGVY